MTFVELLSLSLGFLSLVLTWYFGTRKKRLNNKVKQYEKKLSKLEKYSSNTGYKVMIQDCFLSFSYVGSILLIYFGIKLLPINFNLSSELNSLFGAFASGVLIGSGFVLLELFILLTKTNSSSESIKSLKIKIDKLKEKQNNI